MNTKGKFFTWCWTHITDEKSTHKITGVFEIKGAEKNWGKSIFNFLWSCHEIRSQKILNLWKFFREQASTSTHWRSGKLLPWPTWEQFCVGRVHWQEKETFLCWCNYRGQPNWHVVLLWATGGQLSPGQHYYKRWGKNVYSFEENIAAYVGPVVLKWAPGVSRLNFHFLPYNFCGSFFSNRRRLTYIGNTGKRQSSFWGVAHGSRSCCQRRNYGCIWAV